AGIAVDTYPGAGRGGIGEGSGGLRFRGKQWPLAPIEVRPAALCVSFAPLPSRPGLFALPHAQSIDSPRLQPMTWCSPLRRCGRDTLASTGIAKPLPSSRRNQRCVLNVG
ncbi:MAG: hypothetical protein KDF95_17770, partial [Rhodocyclaceae bacterium]|nr:hypothetical protein [Rhodocyclaceae bacterium]